MKKNLKTFFLTKFFSKQNRKKEGSILLISIILSGMILSIGAGAAKILIKEVEFTSDLLFAEKSYFAAESGVEIALLELKELPVRNIKEQNIPLGKGTLSKLTIENRVDEFELKLPPNGNSKFQLKRQTNENDPLGMLNIGTQKVASFSIQNPESKKFHWKILCKKTDKTVAIQSDEENPTFDSQIATGTFEDENGALVHTSSLNTFLQNPTHQNCFISVENLTAAPLTLTLKATQNMAPNKSKITAIGKSGRREKRIVFDYAQKNLGSLFDFVFFHSDDGI